MIDSRYFYIGSETLEESTYKTPFPLILVVEFAIFKIKYDLKTGLKSMSLPLKFKAQAISSNLDVIYNCPFYFSTTS